MNVLVNGYKCRAIVDSGCTTTMISSGLIDLMPNVKATVSPTNLGFFGVGESMM